MSSLRAQATRGLKWQAIEIGGRQLLSLAVLAVLTRLLAPADFGLLGMVAIYLALMTLVVDLGMGTAIIQRKELTSEHLDAAFWFTMASATVFAVATILLAHPIAGMFDDPRLAPLLAVGSLSLIFTALGAVHAAQFVRQMDFRRPAMRTLVANAAGGVVGVAMALAGFGVWALIGQQVVGAAAGAAVLWIASPWRPRISTSLTHLRDLLSVGSATLATGLLWFFSSRLDQIVIGRVLGAATLGQYTVGTKLADLARMSLHQPVATVALSGLSRIQHSNSRLCETTYEGMRYVGLIAFPTFLGLSAVAPSAVKVVFGAQWTASSDILSLFSVLMLLNFLQVFFHPLLIATGGIGRYVLLNIAHTLGTLVACGIGSVIGVNWLVIGLTVNTVFIGALALAYLRGRLGLDWRQYLRPCLLPGAAAIIMFACLRGLGQFMESMSELVTLAVQCVVGATIYTGVVHLLDSRLLPDLLVKMWKSSQANTQKSVPSLNGTTP